MVITGDGKGKTTSAFGQAVRAAGGGLSVVVIQFIKGAWKTGEVSALARTSLPITIERTGLGFTIEGLRDPRIPIADHVAAAQRGLAIARGHLLGGKADLVILDEIFGALLAELVSLEDVLELVRSRPTDVHLLLTGRNAPQALIELADLVSEVRLVRHPLEKGVLAQRGIEF